MDEKQGTALSQRTILELVKNRHITAGEGSQLIQDLQEIRTVRRQGIKNQQSIDGIIAVIGISGRFPGADDVETFWNNLAAGRETVAEVPPGRWRTIQADENIYCRRAGLLEEIDRFDPLFFNISPREAEEMDPRQRLFLLEAWKALEDAGYADSKLEESNCGVYVGCQEGDYFNSLPEEERNQCGANAFIGNSNAILAARISYFLNLRGPSLAVDTACSSSLVAVHLACESLRNGSCRMALAGGISLLTSPTPVILLGKTGMLSPSGKCKTFDNDGDGFVIAEAVGTVVLKPLTAAQAENDHVYAVIKGSGINQDGKTNSITAPSAPSQTALELSVYEKYDIQPRTIGYVEAHGTGTKLGDPIEVQALTDTFRNFTDETQFCPIGSVKANIGHPAAAAGIAGLIKVLCSLKNKKWVPSINFNRENEHIDFKKSPFYVNRELCDWPAPVDRMPRRAVISSFGFSGTNCHLVVEEATKSFPRDRGNDATTVPWRMIPLSAKTETALMQRIEDLSNWLKKEGGHNLLGDIAYTLAAGRSHFSLRFVLVVKDIHDLEMKLNRVMSGHPPGTHREPEEDYLTNIDRDVDNPGSTPALRELGARLIQELNETGAGGAEPDKYKQKLLALADLYIRGIEPDWHGLYSGQPLSRISLPTYPFDLERCWMENTTGDTRRRTFSGKETGSENSRLHPLVERNLSTLYEEKFALRLTGDEFFLAHHLINGRKVLPAVAVIEMARAAGELAGEGRVRRLSDIVWLRPITWPEGGDELELYIRFFPRESALIEFEVSSLQEGLRPCLHVQGALELESGTTESASIETVDLASLKAGCTDRVDGSDCYRVFRSNGLHLGPSFQVVRELFVNETEVLSLISIPRDLEAGLAELRLHPSLMDGALHSAVGLGIKSGEHNGLNIPFSIGQVDIFSPLPATCWVHISEARESQPLTGGGRRSHLKIMDESGKVVVKIEDFLVRPLGQSGDTLHSTVLYFRPVWREHEEHELEKKHAEIKGPLLVLDYDRDLLDAVGGGDNQHLLVKPGARFRRLEDHIYEMNPRRERDYQLLAAEIRRRNPQSMPLHIIHRWSRQAVAGGEDDIPSRLDRTVYSLVHLFRALAGRGDEFGGSAEILYVYHTGVEEPIPIDEAVSAMARTMGLEYPGFRVKTVAADHSLPLEHIILAELSSTSGSNHDVRWHEGVRRVKTWQELDAGKADYGSALLKQGGVYLITGGLGGLALIFARYLAREFKAKLVLTDRFHLDDRREAGIRELEALGADVAYMTADLGCREDVIRLVKEAKGRFKILNGIIHSAGVVRDELLIKKKLQDFGDVLAPKVQGTVYLDEATGGEHLDFFIMFSSLAAVTGNAGQADYTFANSFLDHFARWRENLRQQKRRRGRTLSINWPLWLEGGLKVNKQTEAYLRQTWGIEALATETGLRAFNEILSTAEAQVLVLSGEAAKIRSRMSAYLQPAGPASSRPESKGSRVTETNELYQRIRRAVVKSAAVVAKVDETRLKPAARLSEYGFDSITFVEFANHINRSYRLDIKPTIFFEYPTIDTFARYLFNEYREPLSRNLGQADDTPSMNKEGTPPGTGPVEERSGNESREHAFRRWPTLPDSATLPGRYDSVAKGFEPVAVVGMAGIMPQAADLEIFWKYLEEGQNLISRVPSHRWQWGGFDRALAREPDIGTVIWGGFMEEVDKFDALFFGISPREAELMDPQQRIFLETVWKTIENAGYRARDLSGTKTGLFVGVSTSDYSDVLKEYNIKVEAHLSTGLAHSVLANRISFLLDLHGPSEPVDTACSSSLVAVHRAVEAIHSGSCDAAIAGGVNVLLSPTVFISFIKAGMLCPDGRCKTFDSRADGYVRGEGSAALFLKPLERALTDGDHIYGLVKSTAVNHGGHASSLTAPNPAAQAELLVDCYEKAGIDPVTVSYIETHGTGTSLGDPVEINGLKKAFAELYRKRNLAPTEGRCGLGSVKTNIGHLEAAAGVAGLVKVLLAMKYQKLPATVNFETLNPYIQLAGSPFYIVHHTREWPASPDMEGRSAPRRAGVSSFGFGGANAHVVLEEWPGEQRRQSSPAPRAFQLQLFILSARSEERLREYVDIWVKFLESNAGSSDFVDSGESAEDPGGNNPGLLKIIRENVIRFSAELAHVPDAEIDPDEDFAEYGLDQVQLAELALRIGEAHGFDCPGDVFTDLSTVNRLSRFVLRQKAATSISESRPPVKASPCRRSLNLEDVAYTLQVGREPMGQRLALIVSDFRDLKEKLNRYLREAENNGFFFSGNVAANRQIAEFFRHGNEGREYLNITVRERKFERLAQLWVAGVEIDWRQLYTGRSPRRIPLPTYPFTRERYWADGRTSGEEVAAQRSKLAAETASELPQPAKPEGNSRSWQEMLSRRPAEGKRELLEVLLREEIGRMLKLKDRQDLDPRLPLVNVGLDSLMALQLKKQVEMELGQDMSLIKFLGGESIHDLVEMILPSLSGEESAVSSAYSAGETATDNGPNHVLEGVI